MAVRRPHVRSAPIRNPQKSSQKADPTYAAWSWPGDITPADLDDAGFSPQFSPYKSGVIVVKIAIYALSINVDTPDGDEVIVRFWNDTAPIGSLLLPDTGIPSAASMVVSFPTNNDRFWVSASSSLTPDTDVVCTDLSAIMWYRPFAGPFGG